MLDICGVKKCVYKKITNDKKKCDTIIGHNIG